MGDLGEMRLKIGVDISALVTGLKKGEAASADFGRKVKNVFGNSSNGLDPLVKSSNSASFALTNLGRVAQDSAFGFVAISNNLNPLLESFQRLKAESGSNKVALQSLASSLIGGGGVGLALSVITAAVTFAKVGFGAWTRGLSGNKAALEENSKAAKEAKDAYDGILGSVTKEAAQVAVIVEQLKKEILTRKQRTAAIVELQKISPEYFANLNTEKAKIEEITAAYNLYSASIIRAITYKLREKQLEDVTQKILDLQKKRVDFNKEEVDENGKLLKTKNAFYDAETSGESEYQKFASGRGTLTKAQNIELQNLLKTQKDLIGLQAKDAPKPGGGIDAGKTKKEAETIADVLAKLILQLDFLNRKELVFKTDLAETKIKAVESTIDHLLEKFKLSADNPIIFDLKARINQIELIEQLKKVFNPKGAVKIPLEIQLEALKPEVKFPAGSFDKQIFKDSVLSELKKLGITKTIPVQIGLDITGKPIIAESEKITDNTSIEKLLPTLETGRKAMADFANDSARLITSVLNPAFDALFTSITDGSGNAFENFGNALNQAIKQITITLFKAIALGAVLAAITGQPFNIGAILTNSLKGFAEGGHVKGPGGPKSDSIVARLSAGEYVMPASVVSKYGVSFFDSLRQGLDYGNYMTGKGFPKFSGGGIVSPSLVSNPGNVSAIGLLTGQQVYIAESKVRGQDLITIYNRASATYKRNS